ncbi:MAG: hypothetical protein HQK91_04100 [Nitrospirae bacterium]|nr:hypothetical protein [Nitrospirota bacterium]MBF0540618.1 hypothetical protein [Nitrospirota bacterium]
MIDVKIDVVKNIATVIYDSDKTKVDQLRKDLTDAGYVEKSLNTKP